MSLDESLCLDEQKGPETPQVCAAGQEQTRGRQSGRLPGGPLRQRPGCLVLRTPSPPAQMPRHAGRPRVTPVVWKDLEILALSFPEGLAWEPQASAVWSQGDQKRLTDAQCATKSCRLEGERQHRRGEVRGLGDRMDRHYGTPGRCPAGISSTCEGVLLSPFVWAPGTQRGRQAPACSHTSVPAEPSGTSHPLGRPHHVCRKDWLPENLTHVPLHRGVDTVIWVVKRKDGIWPGRSAALPRRSGESSW